MAVKRIVFTPMKPRMRIYFKYGKVWLALLGRNRYDTWDELEHYCFIRDHFQGHVMLVRPAAS